jgi:hypothetical protein
MSFATLLFSRVRPYTGHPAYTPVPAIAFAEIAADGSSHILIPFELLIYLMLALVPSAGIGIGKLAPTPSPSSNEESGVS